MKTKTKKILGAIIPFAIIELLLIAILVTIIALQIITLEEMPVLFFIFMAIYLLTPIICLIVALIMRIKEINSGEEDEASKY